MIPPDYPHDPEFLAGMYAQLVDPEHPQAAHDGCLAGLKSAGL